MFILVFDVSGAGFASVFVQQIARGEAEAGGVDGDVTLRGARGGQGGGGDHAGGQPASPTWR